MPNLFQLLSPAAERSPQFYVGTFELIRNSLDSAPRNSRRLLLDTRLTGNRNSGHEFHDGCRQNGVIGRALSPEERWALVEYLKVLGAPRNSSAAWSRPRPHPDARPEMPGAGATDRATLNLGNGEARGHGAAAPLHLEQPLSFRGTPSQRIRGEVIVAHSRLQEE
ncbi:hypothetical protein P4233_22730 [Pseudomonas aeruginosa]|nr:hypothetical protein [Pseudomonas aeruginosa]